MGPETITMVSSMLSAVVAIVVCLINNKYQHSKAMALVTYRLDELEKKMDKHNNLVERTYCLEEKTAVQAEQIKVANHRIEDLEKGAGK